MVYPKISIVTPSFNQAKYLETTIRSVLDQGYPNLEYIVIDGGSTDGSVEIIKKYASNLAYWVSEPDRGQSHAINKGFQKATGEIMAWLNSDDYYHSKTLWTVAEKLNNQRMTLLIGSSNQMDEEKSEQADDHRKPSWEEMVYDGRTIPQPSVFWTRDLWEEAGPVDESLYFVMDYDLWLRMRHKAEQEIMTDDILSYIHLHSEQKWRRAERDNTLAKYTQERAAVSVQAAIARGENPVIWLLRLWRYRIKQAVNSRNYHRIKGSQYHWQATKQVFCHRFTNKSS
jgi:glycosyltransferase involved in cell wall biosynthesis